MYLTTYLFIYHNYDGVKKCRVKINPNVLDLFCMYILSNGILFLLYTGTGRIEKNQQQQNMKQMEIIFPLCPFTVMSFMYMNFILSSLEYCYIWKVIFHFSPYLERWCYFSLICTYRYIYTYIKPKTIWRGKIHTQPHRVCWQHTCTTQK